MSQRTNHIKTLRGEIRTDQKEYVCLSARVGIQNTSFSPQLKRSLVLSLMMDSSQPLCALHRPLIRLYPAFLLSCSLVDLTSITVSYQAALSGGQGYYSTYITLQNNLPNIRNVKLKKANTWNSWEENMKLTFPSKKKKKERFKYKVSNFNKPQVTLEYVQSAPGAFSPCQLKQINTISEKSTPSQF